MKQSVIDNAKKTFLAMNNPYGSVEKVFPLAINSFNDSDEVIYFGVKNVGPIPFSIIKKLGNKGYALHTLDKGSHSGRAVDFELINPISGKWMTGSSSGTAINVFLGINDLGIGTDGGGSVIAPAMAVQCYGFISPLIEQDYMRQFEKISTDNISFYPSLGFITRSFEVMKSAINAVLELPIKNSIQNEVINVICPNDEFLVNGNQAGKKIQSVLEELKEVDIVTTSIPEFDMDRKPMINFLSKQIENCDVFISYEAKIDVFGIGDSVLGHFDEMTQANQEKSGKFLIRVANMVKATTITIPSKEFASGYTLFCESKPEKIKKMLYVAEQFCTEEDELLNRYFRDHDSYFNDGIFDLKKF